jgi:predicted histone-like DNA-binding protein
MAIKYFKYKRKVFSNGEVKEKFMPQIQVESPVDFEQIADMIEKKSTMSRGDIMGVLAELEVTTCYMLENGHPVTLGLMGTFYPYIEATTVDDAQSVTSRLIKRFKIIFKPSTYLKKRLKHISFVLGDNIVREVKPRK